MTLDRTEECVSDRVEGDQAFVNPMGPKTNIPRHFTLLWKVLTGLCAIVGRMPDNEWN